MKGKIEYFIAYSAQKGKEIMNCCTSVFMDRKVSSFEDILNIQKSIESKFLYTDVTIANFIELKSEEEKKPHFLRETNGDTFLVPSERVEKFDLLVTQIEDEKEDEITHELNSKFDDSFGEYRVEGNLYETELFLTKHPNEK